MPTRRVMIDHITIGVSDLQRSRDFYVQALAPLGFDETNTSDVLPSEIEFGSAEKMDFAISTDYGVGAPSTSRSPPTRSSRCTPSTPPRSRPAGANTGRPGHDRTTARATTAPSCSTPTGTTSRPSSTAGPPVVAPAASHRAGWRPDREATVGGDAVAFSGGRRRD